MIAGEFSGIPERVRPCYLYKKKDKSRDRVSVYRRLAVEIRDGVKKIQRKKVLNGVNMKAASGEIYAILGPSKTGKSTLLHTILGIETLDHGNLEIFGTSLNVHQQFDQQVGFMPQKDSLFSTFTSNEILRYYSYLMGLESSYINQRVSFLGELLSLPLEQTPVRFMDENIKRRLSLAVALLHEPQLLVLDEPTFGILPNLREGIWNHLLNIVENENKTVIVATQDSKEAEKAHRVGIMLNGKIVFENEPEILMRQTKEESFESIYEAVYEETFFCKKSNSVTFSSEETSTSPTSANESSTSTDDTRPRKREGSLGFTVVTHEDIDEPPITSLSRIQKCLDQTKVYCWTLKANCHNECPKMKYITLAVWKEIIICIKNFYWVLAMITFPFILSLLAILFLDAIPNTLEVGVINYEANLTDNCPLSLKSCEYFNSVNPLTIRFQYGDFTENLEDSKYTGNMTAIVEVPDNFSSQLIEYLTMLKHDNPTIEINLPKMVLTFKTKHMADALTIINEFEKLKRDFFLSADLDVNFESDTFPFSEIEMETFDCIGPCKISDDIILYSSYILLMGTHYMLSYLSFFRVIVSRKIGLFNMFRVLGISPIEEIISYILMIEIIYLITTAVTFYFFLHFIGLYRQNIWAITLLRLTTSWIYLTFGMFLALTSNSVKAAGSGYLFSLLLFDITTLSFGNINQLPSWLSKILKWAPFSNTSNALKNILLKKPTNTYASVVMEIITPIFFIFLSLILYLVLRRFVVNDAKFK